MISIAYGLFLVLLFVVFVIPGIIPRALRINDTTIFLILLITKHFPIIWYYMAFRTGLSLFYLAIESPPSPNFKHFTIYEALLLGTIIYCQTYNSLFQGSSPASPLHSFPLNVLNTACFFASYFDFKDLSRATIFYLGVFFAFFLLCGLQIWKFEAASSFLDRIFSHILIQNYHLFFYLLFSTILGVAFLYKCGVHSKHALIVKRKYFHIFAAILMLPPLLINPSFTSLAINTAFFIFIFVEASRRFLSHRFSFLLSLDASLKLFACEEEKQANFIFSPLYLLLGIALPQILDPYALEKPLFLSLGIIFLGFGDTAAAVIGSKYGKRKVFGSKTLQGCIAGFCAMLGALVCIIWTLSRFSSIQESSLQSEILPALGAVAAASVSELYLRNDNLSVPPVMIVVYCGLSGILN